MQRFDTQDTEAVTANFRIIGRLKRSTFSREAPDPIDEALDGVLQWSRSIRMQSERLSKDMAVEISLLKDGGRTFRRASSVTSCDEHLLLVCAANLHRALEKVPNRARRQLVLPKRPVRALWLLRNIYEHWDGLRSHLRAGTDDPKGTLKKIRAEFPAADPFSFVFDGTLNEICIADVVELKPFVQDLRRLEAKVLHLQRALLKSASIKNESGS